MGKSLYASRLRLGDQPSAGAVPRPGGTCLPAEPPQPLMETSLLLSQDSLPNRPASAAAFAKQFATASPLDRNGGVASENADHAGAIQEEHTEVVRVIGGV